MSNSDAPRRSERTPVMHRLLLVMVDSFGAELFRETVMTLETSPGGARICGRRRLEPGWLGTITMISTGREAHIRVVWQVPSDVRTEYEAGIELLDAPDFWEWTA